MFREPRYSAFEAWKAVLHLCSMWNPDIFSWKIRYSPFNGYSKFKQFRVRNGAPNGSRLNFVQADCANARKVSLQNWAAKFHGRILNDDASYYTCRYLCSRFQQRTRAGGLFNSRPIKTITGIRSKKRFSGRPGICGY